MNAITSAATHLSPIGAVERAYAADKGLAPRRRLGCTAHVEGELVIDVPPESQVHKQVVRKEADAHPIEINPVVRLYYVEVEEPDLDALRAQGFDDEDIWDITAVTALFALSNRLAHVMALRPNEEFQLLGRVPRAR